MVNSVTAKKTVGLNLVKRKERKGKTYTGIIKQ